MKEEKNITEQMWNKSLTHLKEMRNLAIALGPVGAFYIQGCNELEERYNEGERTPKLYNEIMDLH